jgi:hypothetical protein
MEFRTDRDELFASKFYAYWRVSQSELPLNLFLLRMLASEGVGDSSVSFTSATIECGQFAVASLVFLATPAGAKRIATDFAHQAESAPIDHAISAAGT